MKRFNMLRRLSFKAVAGLGIVAVAAHVARAQSVFSDVQDNHWAAAAVKRLAEAGIIEGYPAVAPQRPSWVQKRLSNPALHQTSTVQPLIKSALAANAALKGTEINVDTTLEAIFLNGTVVNSAQSKVAEAIARQKAGNLKVVNNLTVAPKPNRIK